MRGRSPNQASDLGCLPSGRSRAAQAGGVVAHALGHRRELRRPSPLRSVVAPEAQRHVRHGEVLAQVVIQRLQQRAQVAARRAARATSRCIFSPMASFSSPNWISSRELGLQHACSFSRSVSIWRSEIGMARPPCGCGTVDRASISAYWSKNPRVVLQVAARRFVSCVSCRVSSDFDLALNTVTAGPVIQHRIVPRPPSDRQCRRRGWRPRTGESSRPRRMPATTAAQAPVPQASVSPAPRSYTRSRMRLRSTHLHEAGVHALRKARVVLDQRALRRRPAPHRRRPPPAPRAGCPSTRR